MASEVVCQLFYVFLTVLSFCRALLDIEEIKNVHYNFDLLPEPVLLEKTGEGVFMHISSQYGQIYQCSLPDNAIEEKWRQEKEKQAVEMGISELMKPLKDSPCIVYTKDWWSYEFCYGKTVKQYHMDDGVVISDIILLGQYESEKDWSNHTEDSNNKHMDRFHSQQYVNGTACDLTKQPRSVEVRFVCEEGQGDIISKIHEPSTCTYVMTVSTYRICHHPYLRPRLRKKPKKITCSPALDQQQLTNYKSTFISSETSTINDKMELPKPKGNTESETDKATDQQELTTKDLAESLGLKQDDVNGEVDVKWITDPKELKNMMKEIQEDETSDKPKKFPTDRNRNNKVEKSNAETETPGGKSDTETEASSVDSDTEETEQDKQIMKEFDKEVQTMKNKEKFSKLKGNINSVMQSKFDDIINEAKAELSDQGEPDADLDKSVAYKELAKTLNKLVNRLDIETQELKKAEENLRLSEEEFENRRKALTEGDKKVTALESDKKSEKQDKKSQDRVVVRVSKFRQNAKDSNTEELSVKDKMAQDIEKSVEEELQKAGINMGDRKLKVKIITSGAFNEDGKDNTVTHLSEEDTKAFNNMIISFLGGGQLASQEIKKQKTMEDSYRFVYGQKLTSSKEKTLKKNAQ